METKERDTSLQVEENREAEEMGRSRLMQQGILEKEVHLALATYIFVQNSQITQTHIKAFNQKLSLSEYFPN